MSVSGFINEDRVTSKAIAICSVFEELLNKYDITIPSEDRTGAEEEARIFGEVYYELEDKIKEILCK